MAGERAQLDGLNGLHRAKRWLDLSTRVVQMWTCLEQPLADLLHFSWPHSGQQFSFDLGGKFRGERIDRQTFMAEVKAYRKESDLPRHYREFLAKSYVAYREASNRCDHLLWISWSPFQAQRWDLHRSPETVSSAILHPDNRMRVFGTAEEAEAAVQIDHPVVQSVAQRLWLVTLCDELEDMVPTLEHYAVLQALIALQDGKGGP